ncbi:hypothetical protein [Prosthecobacter sp.]|uniref:hypothetical protein n=1 Tax=Prosthecobacter sp. TaxID=1965333 RepID=UPI003783C864
MRWCLLIPNLFVLLMLGMEQCCWSGTPVAKDASHLVCVLDDDESELKQGLPHEQALSECDLPPMLGWHGETRLETAASLAPFIGTENGRTHPGIRRHRWLCQERC